MTIQTKPTSDAYRSGWDATFRRSTVEVDIKPGDTMRRLSVGGIVPKPREQYEREVEALESRLLSGYGPATFKPFQLEPLLPEGWAYEEPTNCLYGPEVHAYPETDSLGVYPHSDEAIIPWPVIRWLAWKAGVKV